MSQITIELKPSEELKALLEGILAALKPQTVSIDTPLIAAPEQAEKPTPTAATPETPVPSLVDLRALAKEKGKDIVKPLLDKYGFSGISGVPEDRRAEFMAALQEA